MLRMILVLAALAHSAAISKRIVLPGGETGYSIRCDNENINACYEKAGEVCHRGYAIQNQATLVGSESMAVGYVVPGFLPGTITGSASSVSSTTSEKGFLITCKDPEVTEYERIQRQKKIEAQQAAEYEKGAETARITMGIIAAVFVVAIGAAIGSSLASE